MIKCPMLKKALIRDTGNAAHYVEAVKTAHGLKLQHSVKIQPCEVSNLTEREAEDLMDRITSLLRKAV